MKSESQVDPLEILVVPHAVIEWQKRRGILLSRLLPEVSKREREKGKYAIFHGNTRLHKVFDRVEQANASILEIMGEKRKCWENKRIFTVKQL